MCYDIVSSIKPGIYSVIGFDGFQLSAGSKQLIERFGNFEVMVK